MIRLRVAKVVGFIPTNIMSFFINWELSYFSSMTYVMVSWITELCIVSHRITGIHPLIIRLTERRLVIPSRTGSKIGFVFRQIHFNQPYCTSQPFIRRNIATHTSIFFLLYPIIYWSTRRWSVTDYTEVKFNTTRHPRSTHGNIPKLHNSI